MPRSSEKRLSYKENENITLIKWILFQMEMRGHPDIESVQIHLGLHSNSSKIALLKSFQSTKHIYQNYIDKGFSNNEWVCDNLMNGYSSDDY